MILTKSQKKATINLFNAYLEREKNKICYFKSPTGSGKTFMASSLISMIHADAKSRGKKSIIVVATISNSELPEEFSKKLKEYKAYHEFQEYDINFVSSPSAAKAFKKEDIKGFEVSDKKTYVFGLSSFGKNTLFRENNVLGTFIDEIKADTDYELTYIRDEAHIGKKFGFTQSDRNNFEKLMNDNSDFIMAMTATPKQGGAFVELTREEMQDDGVFLLKTEAKLPTFIDGTTNEEIIDRAIEVFKNVKKKYNNSNLVPHNINPAMLIQVSNDSSINKENHHLFLQGMEILEQKLKEAGLKYLKYFSKNKGIVVGTEAPATLSYASKNDSTIDVIIFKVGPATGWDIPRANMLLQLRNISSETLKMQTIGRIMRNPIPGLKKNEITNKYYLFSYWGNVSTRDSVTYTLREKFKNKKLYSGKIIQNKRIIENDNKAYKKQIIELLNSSVFKNKVKDTNESNIVYPNTKFQKLSNDIPIKNIFYLKIFNLSKKYEYSNLIYDWFDNLIDELSNDLKKNKEIIYYCLWYFIPEIKNIKNNLALSSDNKDYYKISRESNLMGNYSIWKDNDSPKLVDTKKIENYGYSLLSNDNEENIQYLDSEPELMFYNQFTTQINSIQMKNIKFFSKMPTLGSEIFFEYYSRTESKIKKSYMDFAIEYKNKVIMVEVKSLEDDYDSEKTQDLLHSYVKYMSKYDNNNLTLLLYQWNKKKQTGKLNMMIDGEWKEDVTMADAVYYIFD